MGGQTAAAPTNPAGRSAAPPPHGEQHVAAPEGEAGQGHPRGARGHRVQGGHQVGLEPGVVEARAQGQGIAGAAQVHAHHVPALFPRNRPAATP